MRHLIDRLKFYLNDERGFLGLGSIVGGVVGGLGGLFGGSGKQQTTTQATLPPWAQQYLQQTAGIASRDATRIGNGNPLVGGLDPRSLQAFAAAQQGLGQAGDIFGFGQNLAQGAYGGATAPIASQIGQFQNPYLNQQLGQYEQDLARGLDISRLGNQQAATAAGAYGGARHGIAQGLGDAEALRNFTGQVIGARQGDFSQALNAAFQNQGAQAGLLNLGFGAMGSGLQGLYQGAGQLGQFGQYARGVGNEQRQDPLRRAMAEQQLRGLGSGQFGLLAGSQGSVQNQAPWLSRLLGGVSTGIGAAGLIGGGSGGNQSNWFNFSNIGA